MNINFDGDIERGTNIMEVDVPAALERTVETKCSHWDVACGGEGMTPSCSLLFTGTPGAGKTTQMLQLADAITSAGHVCLFNGNEESVVQLRKTVKRLGLRHGFVVGNDRLVADMLDHARELQAACHGQTAKDGSPRQVFLIVDSLQTMDDGMYANGHTNSNTPVRVTEMVTTWCKEEQKANEDDEDGTGAFGIAIIIGQVTKGGEFSGKNAIKHAVDAHLHLRIDMDPKSDSYEKRLLEVRKNRFGGGSPAYVLNMTSSGLREDGSF